MRGTPSAIWSIARWRPGCSARRAPRERIHNEAFNIGSADVPPIRQMVEEVLARVGSASTVRGIPVMVAQIAMALLRPFGRAPLEPEHLAIAVSDYVFDIAKARQMLGWEPRWGNVDAVVDTYQADFQ